MKPSSALVFAMVFSALSVIACEQDPDDEDKIDQSSSHFVLCSIGTSFQKKAVLELRGARASDSYTLQAGDNPDRVQCFGDGDDWDSSDVTYELFAMTRDGARRSWFVNLNHEKVISFSLDSEWAAAGTEYRLAQSAPGDIAVAYSEPNCNPDSMQLSF